MASVQEPEVVLAQRLASNEKAIRTKAIKKLRKYISVRSQNAGGFTGDELLRLWKGLFYCLWMQDKPLLQEELSNRISTLIHSFHGTDAQLMYLESFMQTFTREWTGIDRLRMDKFYQVVRFMFRQTFEMLKRTNWDNSVVAKFLQLLTSHVLQKDSEAPSGLQLHILDLYLSELAAVGSAELTADQNLTFIEPFCKTAAKTKNRMLFSAICNRIFNTIIDQAPFAVEDLMKEVNAADSDSGQASEEDEKYEEDKIKSKAVCKKQINGKKPKNDDEDEDDDDDDDDEEEEEMEEEEVDEDELLHLEDSDTEVPDDDVGPVLQFDYAALADKLFQLASRSSTPGVNRQKLYKIIKVLRELSEGIFPQSEYPEDVSTDEDDDMFGSRKRMKRAARREGDEEAAPTGKKSKADPGKKTEELGKQNDKSDAVDAPVSNANKKKKKKKKKRKAGSKEESQEQAESVTEETETSLKCGQDLQKAELQSSTSSSQVTEAQTPKVLSETLVLPETQRLPSVPVSEEEGKPKLCAAHENNLSKKRRNLCESESDLTERGKEQLSSSTTETPSEAKVKKKKKNKKKDLKAEPDTEILLVSCETSGEDKPIASSEAADRGSARSKKKSQKPNASVSQDEMDPIPQELAAGVPTPLKKKKKQKASTATEGEAPSPQTDAETTPTHKKKKTVTLTGGLLNGSQDAELPSTEADVIMSAGKRAKKKKRKIPVEFEFEADEVEEATTPVSCTPEAKSHGKKTKLNRDVDIPFTPLSLKSSLKKKKSLEGSKSDFITFQRRLSVPTPLFCKTTRSPNTPVSKKKKRGTPKSESKKVTFGLKNNKTAEFKKTDRSLLLSPDGSSRVAFDPQQKPKFGVLKSPTGTVTTNLRKTPGSIQKTPGSIKKTPGSTKKTPGSIKKIPGSTKKTQENTTLAKRRPLAADFF